MPTSVIRSKAERLQHRTRALAAAAQSTVNLLRDSFRPMGLSRAVAAERRFEQLEARTLFASDLPLHSIGPIGGRIYGATVAQSLIDSSDVGEFTVNVAAGQKLAVQVTPKSGSLKPRIEIFSIAENKVVADVTASANGSAVVIQPTMVSAGSYALRVHAAGAAGGAYKLTAQLNASFENESSGGAANNTPGTGQTLVPSTTIQNDGQLYSVSGVGGHDSDFYKVTLTAGEYASILLDSPDSGYSGQFGASTTVRTISNSNLVRTGDLNNDGLTDIVVASSESFGFQTQLSTLINLGDGSFERHDFNPYYFNAADMVVTDLDGDGNDDVAIVSAGWTYPYSPSGQGHLTLLTSNGEGEFYWYDQGLDNSPASIVAGDFNDDGSTDLAVGGFSDDNSPATGRVSFFVNDGFGGISYDTYFSTPQNVYSLAAGDVDHDGVLDLVVGEGNEASINSLGDQNRGLIEVVQTQPWDLSIANRLTTADYSSAILRVALGNLDTDGNLDIVAARQGGNGGGSIEGIRLDENGYGILFFGQNLLGDGGFAYGASLVLTDINHDGFSDVIATRGDSYPTDRIMVGLNDGGYFNYQYDLGDTDAVRGLALADFNGDGELDLVAAHQHEQYDGEYYSELSIISGRGDVRLQLVNAAGDVIALSEGWPGYDAEQAIADFRAPTTGTYYIKVTADPLQQYSVSMSRNARLRLNPDQPNGRDADLTQAHNAVGYLRQFEGHNYAIRVKAGDVIDINMMARLLGQGDPENNLHPQILLFLNDVEVASDTNSGTSTAHVSYAATADGTLRVYVNGNNGTVGDYDLAMTGATAGVAPMSVTGHSPSEGANLGYAPYVYLDFSQPIDFSSLTGDDILVDGLPVTAIFPLDADTVAVFGNQLMVDGAHTVTVASGAILSTLGAPTSAFTLNFDADSQPPRVIGSTLTPNQTFTPGRVEWTVDFSEPLMTFFDAGIFGYIILDPSDIELTNISSGQTYDTSLYQVNDYESVTGLQLAWDNLPEGDYEIRLVSGGGAFTDFYFHGLDGEFNGSFPSGDGNPGGDFLLHFRIDAAGNIVMPPLHAVRPLGTNVYETSVSGAVDSQSDSDSYSLELAAGQVVSVLFEQTHGDAATQIDLIDPNGNIIGSATSAAGASAMLQSLNTNVGGTYHIQITNTAGQGAYTLRVISGAAIEVENGGGAGNDSRDFAQSLESGFASLLSVQRSSVVGQISNGESDYFTLNLAAGQTFSALLGGIGTTSGLSVMLQDADGNLLAVGVTNALNADSAIFDFVAQSTGVYYLRVVGNGRYSMTAIRDGSFERELNDAPVNATDISLTHRGLGHLASGQLPSVIRVAETESDFPLNNANNNSLQLIQQLNDDTFFNFNATQVKINEIDTLEELNQYDVLILDDGNFNIPGLATTLRTWVSQGHAVVATGNIVQRVRTASGASDWDWLIPVAFTNSDTGVTGTWTMTGASSPILQGMSNFNTGSVLYAPVSGADADATVLATSSGRPVAVSKDSMGDHGRSVFLAQVYGWDQNGAVLRSGLNDQLLEQAIAWAALAGDPTDHYTFTAAPGDQLVIQTATPNDAILPPGNRPDIVMDLIDPNGNVVATNDNGAADGRNAKITYNVSTGGQYRVVLRLTGNVGGAYVLDVQGATGTTTVGSPSVVSTTPANGGKLANAPSRIDVVLSDAVRSDSIQASDLVLNGGATVNSFEIIDGRTIRFNITAADVEADYNWTIAAGAFTSLQGIGSAPATGGFHVDKTGPRVVSQSPATDGAAPFNSWQITFSEDIDPASFSTSDIDLRRPDNQNINHLIQSAVVTGNVVTLTFSNQFQSGNYTLYVGPNITDVVGNRMDQDQDGVKGESSQDRYLGTIAITSPNLIVQSIVTPANATFGSTIDVSWTVKNIGADPANGNWIDRVYLSTDDQFVIGQDILLGAFAAGTTPLAGGGTYTQTKTLNLPLTPTILGGTYKILVITDATFTQPEANDTDNTTASSGVNIQPPPLPDLAVTSITVPVSAVSNSSIVVNWDLANLGSADFTGTIQEQVYLSADNQIGSDLLIGTVSFTGTILAGQTISRQETVTIPLNVQGVRRVVVKTDSSSVVYEHNLEPNNTLIDDQNLNVTLAPIPDLVITSLTLPPQEYSGRNVQVQWTITNNGSGPMDGSFYDRLYLSPNNSFDGDEIYYGDFQFTGSIAAGASINRTQTIKLPNDYQGPAYAIVQTDIFNNVFEDTGETGNTVVSAASMNVILDDFPNLVVDSVTAPPTAFTGQQIQVDWFTHNVGTGATSGAQWWDSIYLSPDPTFDNTDSFLTQIPNTSYLNAGESYHGSTLLTLPRELEGPYYLIVYTDRYNSLYELNRDNDNSTASAVMHIDLTPPPDLQVTSVRPPTQMFSGQTAQVRWTVTNTGLGDVPANQGAWYDQVYISQDDQISSGDTNLGVVSHSGALKVGESYNGQMNVKLPVGIQGPYYIIVRTDTYNSTFEQAFEVNNDTPDAVQVILTPPPDLQPTLTSVPGTAFAGQNYVVQFRVDNNGATPAPDTQQSWYDRLYLSTDGTFDPETDIKIGERPHNGGLNDGDSYTTAITGKVPYGLEGQYHIFIQSDTLNQVFELDNDNNTIGQQINVANIPPDLIVSTINAPTTVEAGSIIPINWIITNDSDSGTGWQLDWRDRLVISGDTIPGNGDEIFLDEIYRSGVIGAHGSYTTPTNQLIPFYVPAGNYSLFVYTDYHGQLPEGVFEANNWSAPKPIVVTREIPDLSVTDISTPSLGLSGQMLPVTWTVTNSGTGQTNENVWNDQVYLSVDPLIGGLQDYFLGYVQRTNRLGGGQSYTKTVNFKLPQDITGNYYIIIQTDPFSEVLEANDNNNTSTRAIPIALGPVPDLKVTNVTAPNDVNASQPITVNWTVQNQGNDVATAALHYDWYDNVYLSTDQIFDPLADISLGNVRHSTSLAVGASYSASLTANVPVGLSGPFYVFVVTDKGSFIYERNGELNNATYKPTPTQVHLLPPADLIAGDLVVPANSRAGASVSITYSVNNGSTEPAKGSWQDSLYLSTDDTWDLGDTFIGKVTHTGDVAPGASYTETLTTRLPGVLPGDFKVIIRSDIRNQVPENNKINNIGASIDKISMSVPLLTLGTPDNDTIEKGQGLYYRVVVPAGQTLLVTLDSASTTAANELYVRYGQVPTRASFDYGFDKPLESDQRVIVELTKAGTYYILAFNASETVPSPFSIMAKTIDYSVVDTDFGKGGNVGNRTIQINGAKFDRTVSATLLLPGGDRAATATYPVNTIRFYATFDLKGVTPGTYSVRVTKADGSSVIVPNSLRVVNGGGGQSKPVLYAPGFIGFGIKFRINYAWGNDGYNDIPAPLFKVGADNPLSTVPAGPFDLEQVTFLGTTIDDGPAGILRAKETSAKVLYSISNFSRAPFEVWADRVQNDLSQPMNWDRVRSIMPERDDLTAEQFDAAFNKFKQIAGPTWNDYLLALSRAANVMTKLKGYLSSETTPLRVAFEEAVALTNPSIKGKIFNPDFGVQIEDREVSVLNINTGDRYSVFSNKDGSFVFDHLTPGRYLMNFSGVVGQQQVFDVGSNTHLKNVVINVEAGAAVSGIVTRLSNGQRVEGAVVTYRNADGESVSTSTDEDGFYKIEGLAGGVYDVRISAEGLSTIHQNGVTVGSNGLSLGFTLAPQAKVTGVINATGGLTTSSIGAIARLAGSTDSFDLYSGYAEGNNFTIDRLPAGVYDITFIRPGYISQTLTNVNVGAGATVNLSAVTLAVAPSISGTITRAGLPAGDAVIDIFNGDELVATAATDANGNYSIDNLPVGNYTLRVDQALSQAIVQAITFNPGEQVVRNFALAVQGVLSGTVTANGKPVANLGITLKYPDGSKKGTRTDENGKYSFIHLALGGYVLSLASGTERQTFTVTNTGLDRTQNFSLTAGGIKGKLTNTDGSKGKFGNLVLYRGGKEVLAAATQLDGTFSLPILKPGIYDLVAFGNGGYQFPKVQNIVVTAGNTTVLSPIAGGISQLSVHVVDAATGDPLTTQGTVLITKATTSLGFDSFTTLQADASGNVQFVGLAPGEYLIAVLFEDHAYTYQRVTIGAGSNAVTASIGAPSAVNGTLTSEGSAIEGVGVVLYDASDPSKIYEATSDADGNYAMGFVPAGTYRVLVIDRRTELTGPRLKMVDAGTINVTAAGVSGLSFDLAPATADNKITGSLTTASGEAPLDGHIVVTNADGVEVATANSDSTGAFEIEGLVPGTYTLKLRTSGFDYTPVNVVLPASGGIAGVSMQVEWIGVDVPGGSDSSSGGSGSLAAVAASITKPAAPVVHVATTGSGSSFAFDEIIDWSDSWLFNNGIANWIRDLLSKAFGEPKLPPNIVRPKGLDEMAEHCPEQYQIALLAWKNALKYERAMQGFFEGFHAQWEANVSTIAANVGLTGVALLRLAGAMYSFRADGGLAGDWRKSFSDSRGQLQRELLASSDPRSTTRLLAQIGQMDALAEKLAKLTMTPTLSNLFNAIGIADDVIGQFETGLQGLADFANGIKNRSLDFNGVVQGLNSVVQFGKTIADVLVAFNKIENPVIKKWLGPVAEGLNTFAAAVQTVTEASSVLRELAEKKRLFEEAKMHRDQWYHICLRAIADCDEDDDYDPEDADKDFQAFMARPNGWDPNDISGPVGYGPQRYVSSGQPLKYTIQFENDADIATTPVSHVRVITQLDANTDFRTFRLGDFGFGDIVVKVPSNVATYQTEIDLTATKGIYVQVIAGVDPTTGQAFWDFTAIDPETGDEVGNPLMGFLPPNVNEGEGQGFAIYSVRAKSSAVSGDTITAQASIYFDLNPPIDTNIETHTLDVASPLSSATSVEAYDGSSFLVKWSGEDDAAGSGIATYTIWVSRDGGQYERWLEDTTDTQAVFAGTPGVTYSFYSVARDNAGNVEDSPDNADALYLVSGATNLTPVISLGANGAIIEGDTFNQAGNFLDLDIDQTWSATVDYGDGTGVQPLVLSGQTFTLNHVYADNGLYTITVNVTDSLLAVGTSSINVNVANAAPGVSVNPASGVEGSQINLIAALSDAGLLDTHTATVDFGDGSPLVSGSVSEILKSISAGHTYADNGTYTVSVTVTDNDGDSNTSTGTITVTNANPTGLITGAPSSAPAGSAISLNGSATDPGSADTLEYAWTVTRNGSPFTSGAGADFNFNLGSADTYVVTLVVTDDDGGTNTKTATITALAASASITGATTTSNEGAEISLGSSILNFPTGTPVYAWTVTKSGNTVASGSGSTFDFTPIDNGSYVVSLTVTVGEWSATDSRSITVLNVDPTPTGVTINAVDEGSSATLSGSILEPSIADTLTLSVDWGDGSPLQNFPHAAGSTTFNHNHVYANSGTFTVTVTLTDDDGGTGTTTTSIIVNNVVPTATFAPTGAAIAGNDAKVSFTNVSDPSTGDVEAGFIYAYDFDNDGVYEEVTDQPVASHVFASPGSYKVNGRITDQNGGSSEYSTTVVVISAEVVGRYIVYNNSFFDGSTDVGGVSDDAAIATDKSALLPGGTATFANYTSYSKGINSIMFDITGTPTLDASDFVFRVGNVTNVAGWTTAPAPSSISVRPAPGNPGVSRVQIIWDDNLIQKQWLQVTVLPTHTGLANADVFYFGNAVGESGNLASNTIVNATDQILARNSVTLTAGITNAYDFNRDGKVNATDEILARNNGSTAVNSLKLLSVPSSALTSTTTPTRAPTRTPVRAPLAVTTAETGTAQLTPAPAVATSIFSQVPVKTAAQLVTGDSTADDVLTTVTKASKAAK